MLIYITRTLIECPGVLVQAVRACTCAEQYGAIEVVRPPRSFDSSVEALLSFVLTLFKHGYKHQALNLQMQLN